MLVAEFAEGAAGLVTVVDYDEDVMEAALSFLLGTTSSVPCELLMQLFKFADQYSIDPLRREVRRLVNLLAQSPEACAELYEDAFQLRLKAQATNLLRLLCANLAAGELSQYISTWRYPVLEAFCNEVLDFKLDNKVASQHFRILHLLEAVYSWLSASQQKGTSNSSWIWTALTLTN